ncbi:MAG: DUF3187 family protein [Chthonomonadales bacterium]
MVIEFRLHGFGKSCALAWSLGLFFLWFPTRAWTAQTLPDYELIPIRNMRPYNLLFLQIQPAPPDVLSAGHTRLRCQLDIANNLLAPVASPGSTVVEDNEIQRVTLEPAFGIGSDWEVSARIPLLWRNGGMMDPILSFWHRLFGIPADGEDVPLGRDHYGDFHSVLLLRDPSGRVLVNAGNAFGLGDVSFTLKHAWYGSNQPKNAAVRILAKLPTGNPGLLLGSGHPDFGISLDLRINLGSAVAFIANGGCVIAGGAPMALPNRSTLFQYIVGIRYQANRRDAFLWEWESSPAAVVTGNRFADHPQATATFGYRRSLRPGVFLYASFSENGDIHNYTLPWFSAVGPDFTVSAGIEILH